MTFRRSAPAAIIAAVVIIIVVSRLLALTYVTLGTAFLINLLLARFRVVEQLFGRYTQEQCYLVLRWAFPVLVLTVAVAMVLSAIA